jgi:hypothetical protein
MDKWSKKYEKWFRCEESNRHPRNLNLFKFNLYYYNPNTDKLIHQDIVEAYIDNCKKRQKSIKKDAYCIKHNIEIKTENNEI